MFSILIFEMNSSQFQLMIAFWVLCGCGLAAAVIGLLGTCGAMFGNRGTLILYSLAAVLLILIEIGIGVFIIVYSPRVISNFPFYKFIQT